MGITEAKVLAMGMTYILQAYPEERVGTDMAQAAAKEAICCLQESTQFGSLEDLGKLHGATDAKAKVWPGQ